MSNRNIILILSALIILLSACPLNAASKEAIDLGRGNPFGKIEMAKKALPQIVLNSSPRETSDAPELFLENVTLKFLNAKNLQIVIDKMVSEYGSAAVDEKTNSITVCDSREKLDEIVTQINKIDKTPSQIMIEVVILDVQLNDDTEIGVNWDLLTTKEQDHSYRQNLTGTRIGSTVSDATTIGNATAFNSTGLGGDFTIINGDVRNVIHLIQQKRDAEILASPRVMMVSGQSAGIEAVEELPYTELTGTAEGGSQALTSTQFKLVGVKLSVQATQVDSNNIFLSVDAEQNVKTGQSVSEVPIIDTRKARTSLMLKQGQVVVFGGLRRQEKTREVSQIPFLGDLPIIGLLFKSTIDVTKNSELIVFLSPHVYDGTIDPKTVEKYNEIVKKPLLLYPHNQKKKSYK